MNIKKLLFLLTVLVTVGTFGKVSANEFNFSVNPVLPENQANKVGYFDLLMKPGTSQTLTVSVENSTDKTVVVEQAIASATTNINGVVEYSPNTIKSDTSLSYNLADLAKLPKEITLTPHSKQDVHIEINMPNKDFKGIISGGITFKEKNTETKTNSSSKGLSIQNKYAYVVALLMQQDKAKVAPDLKLNTVAPGQVNFRNVINANLQNPKAGYLNQMYVNTTVKSLTNSNLSYTSNKESMQMAPNSNFDYPISVGEGQRIQAGKYRLTMTVYGQKNLNGKYAMKDVKGKEQKFDYQWQFTRDFEITGEKASELNKKDVTVKPDYSWLIWLIVGIIIVLLAFLFFFILWKRRKKEEEENEEMVEKADLQIQLDRIKKELEITSMNSENDNKNQD